MYYIILDINITVIYIYNICLIIQIWQVLRMEHEGGSVDNSGKISNEELYPPSHFTKLVQQETHIKNTFLY